MTEIPSTDPGADVVERVGLDSTGRTDDPFTWADVAQHVADKAAEAFWQSVADFYPDATSGDLSPENTFRAEAAMRAAVAEWQANNVPGAHADWDTVVVGCSQCDAGVYVERDGVGVCEACGHEVNPALDVAPYLDEGERITWTRDTATGARLLAYFPAND